MERIKTIILKKMGKVAYKQAQKEVNRVCPYFHYQTQVPRKVEKLKRIRGYDE
jgi:hypothetical protein